MQEKFSKVLNILLVFIYTGVFITYSPMLKNTKPNQKESRRPCIINHLGGKISECKNKNINVVPLM